MKKSDARVSTALFLVLLGLTVPLVLGICVFLVIQRASDTGQVDQLRGTLDETRRETKGNSETIAKQSATIHDHGTRLDAAESEIRAHADRLGKAESGLAAHGEKLDAQARELDESRKSAAELKGRLDALEKELAAAREERDKDRSKVDALEKRLAELREELKALAEGLARRMERLEQDAAKKQSP